MTVGFQVVLVTTQIPVQTAPARIVDIKSTHTHTHTHTTFFPVIFFPAASLLRIMV